MNARTLERCLTAACLLTTACLEAEPEPDPTGEWSAALEGKEGDEADAGGETGGIAAGELPFAPPVPWLNETFDSYTSPPAPTCLTGHGGWTTLVGATCVLIEAADPCPKLSAKLDGTATLDAWSKLNLPDQSSGTQTVEFDIKRVGVPDGTGTAGKVVFHTTAGPAAPEGILFQVLASDGLRINYGPNPVPDSKTLVGKMEPSRWYHVRVVVQLPAAILDVYVDGQLAYAGLDGSPVAPLTEVSLVGFHGVPGAIFVDNLYAAPVRGPTWVAIDTPSPSATVTGAVPINVSASPDVTRVDFYVEGNLLGSDASAPFSYSWNSGENPLPAPAGGRLMRSGYFYTDQKYGDYRSEVNSFTTWYHAWARLGYSTGDDPPGDAIWLDRMGTALLEAAAQGRHIILQMNLSDVDHPTPVHEVLVRAAPVWGNIDMIEVADDTPWSRAVTEGVIGDLNAAIDAFPLPRKPLSSIFVPGPMSDAINAVGLSIVAPEDYLDAPGSPVSQVNIDLMRAEIAGHQAQAAAAGRQIVLIDQSYTRNGCWGNVDNVRDLQSVTYVEAARDANTLGVNMFAYGRPTGAKTHPELREPHILAGERMTGRTFLSADRGLRTISVKGVTATGAVAWERRVVTVGGPIIHAPLSVPGSTANQTARVIGKPYTATNAWSMTGGTITGATNTNAITYTSGPPGTVMTLNLNESYFGARTVQHKVLADFNDVPTTNLFHDYIASVAVNGVTSGCGAGNYCPNASTTREQMAVFLLLAKYGPGHAPPPAVGLFGDVPVSSPYAPWIEELANLGVVGGCAPGPLYCPTAPVTREQMAVFLLKTQDPSFDPPPATGLFNDVPPSSGFARWIEALAQRGIAGGCSANPPLYCPADPVTRGQMAVFLVKTFNLAFP